MRNIFSEVPSVNFHVSTTEKIQLFWHKETEETIPYFFLKIPESFCRIIFRGSCG